MKLLSLTSLALVASSAFSYPLSLKRQTVIDDVTILQFALTLEHLENVFYKAALSLFSLDDFKKAGFSKKDVQNIEFIAEDEQTHVQLLETAIAAANATPVAACNYVFPITDVQSFVTLSTVLEGVGTSAYLGAASLLSDKNTLTVAASIMVTEALHTGLQRAATNLVPAANAFGTPLGANAVFSLAATFIQSCPSSNFALPFQAFPALAVDSNGCSGSNSTHMQQSSQMLAAKNSTSAGNFTLTQRSNKKFGKHNSKRGGSCSGNTAQGQSVVFVAANTVPADVFVTFVSGLSVISVGVTGGSTVVEILVPFSISGQTFVFITTSAVTTLTDEVIIFGPAIIEVVPSTPVLDITVLK